MTQPIISPSYLQTLQAIERRLLWLATHMVHHANRVRPNPDGSKVGGHQASSASVVSIMTALYFHFLAAGDRVSIKPHASPVLHAAQYLLGQLPQEYLTTLRAYQGLQAYPSRTKDPSPVDFSTGSVGLGAVAPSFAALAHRYTQAHFADAPPRRFVSLIGDAELDEGNVWEAILEQSLSGLGNLLWIIDLNRQSLDRVVPGMKVKLLQAMFRDSGWQVLEAKYGRALQQIFAQPGGALLRRRIDEMSNEEYQALLPLTGAELRPRLVHVGGRDEIGLIELLQPLSDEQLPALFANLGGHDLAELIGALDESGREPGKPTVLFAYTIKGWGLPLAGDPLNHSKLLTQAEMERLRITLEIPAGDGWASFAPDSAPGQLCTQRSRQLYPDNPPAPTRLSAETIPQELAIRTVGEVSTQQAFGQTLMSISRKAELAQRVVTASPDVSTSTNLSGWILKAGVFSAVAHAPRPDEEQPHVSWQYSIHGQHIELGISEMNLFMTLAMFGLSAELCGQQLIPIGTVYDPFVCRGLDALIYGLYSGAKFIFAGTPSGVTLAPEGGAHQSIVTPSLGMELPNLNAYEPAFALELSWIMADALRQCCYDDGRATYLRLSTKLIDQALLEPALARLGRDLLRQQVLAGGYRLVDWRDGVAADGRQPLVHLAASGAMIPEAVAAAKVLQSQGINSNVLNLTSPRRLFEQWRRQQDDQRRDPFVWLIPPDEQQAPIVTLLDGASHALAWLGSVYGAPVVPLGVDSFGQSGALADLYHHFGIDAANIVEAAQKIVEHL
ncbi:MAG: 1-deoxy-D-xylulose-5-phosphate synthase N-terminal domain-containing protein [Caldilineaceae bacterium]